MGGTIGMLEEDMPEAARTMRKTLHIGLNEHYSWVPNDNTLVNLLLNAKYKQLTFLPDEAGDRHALLRRCHRFLLMLVEDMAIKLQEHSKESAEKKTCSNNGKAVQADESSTPETQENMTIADKMRAYVMERRRALQSQANESNNIDALNNDSVARKKN